MMSEVEERPRHVTAGYGRHRSQWVKHAILQQFKQRYNCSNLIPRVSYLTAWVSPRSPQVVR